MRSNVTTLHPEPGKPAMTRTIARILLAGCLVTLGGCSGDPAPQPVTEQPADPPASRVEQAPAPADSEPQEIEYTTRSEGRYRESRFKRAHDMFISADDPSSVPAEQVTFLQNDDEVVGFVINGQPRAYSVRMLSYHHVVNDRVADTPIAVTY